MNSSDFRERFYLVEVSYSVDEAGDQIPTNKIIYSSFAKIANLSAREYWEAYALKQESTLKLLCRWNPIFKSVDTRKHRISWRDKLYGITSISNIDYRNDVCEIRIEVVG